MQPAPVPLTELLQRLVVILTALLDALGLAISEELLAGLLKLGEQREPKGEERGPLLNHLPQGAGAFVRHSHRRLG